MEAIRKKFEGRFQPRRRKARRGKPGGTPGGTPGVLPLRLGVQIAHLFMIVTFLCVSIPRLKIPHGPHYLYIAIGIFISAESLGLLAHELLTENVRSLRARGNERVYMMLNVRGLVLWAAAAFLTVQGNSKLPNGTNLILGQLALVTAIITCLTTICLAVCYFQGGTMQKEPEIPLDTIPSNILPQLAIAPAPEPSIHSDVPNQWERSMVPFHSNALVNSQNSDISSHWSQWSLSTKRENGEHNEDGVSREYQLDTQLSRV